MRTAVVIPEELFSAAEALAARLGVTRSELYATAVAEFVARHDACDVTARLNEVYATEPSVLEAPFRRAQSLTILRADG